MERFLCSHFSSVGNTIKEEVDNKKIALVPTASMDVETVTHPIPPLCDINSRILILGSFPSVKSREQKFFYGHKQNRFWKVMAKLADLEVPATIEEKRKLLLEQGIALWDVIASCTIQGSSDSSIKNAVPNDLSEILNTADIKQIYTNGNKAYDLYMKYMYPVNGREAVKLPSTSPANAAYSLEQLIEHWSVIRR